MPGEATPALLTLGFGGVAAEIELALPSLQAVQEIWPATTAVQRHLLAGTHLAEAGDFCLLRLSAPGEAELQQSYAQLYTQLFTQVLARGYPHLVRLWNYFPGINTVRDGLDGYQHFCLGRAQALDLAPSGIEPHLPAATAIGTASGAAQLIALVARHPGLHYSNPRQIDPIAYPSCYSPRSPNFARATAAGGLLFISGTASIVGHLSLHPEQTLAQCQEILTNLRSVLEVASVPVAHLCQMKVYLRELADQPAVAALLTAELGAVPTLYLEGDICRPELRLEIEAIARR